MFIYTVIIGFCSQFEQLVINWTFFLLQYVSGCSEAGDQCVSVLSVGSSDLWKPS